MGINLVQYWPDANDCTGGQNSGQHLSKASAANSSSARARLTIPLSRPALGSFETSLRPLGYSMKVVDDMIVGVKAWKITDDAQIIQPMVGPETVVSA